MVSWGGLVRPRLPGVARTGAAGLVGSLTVRGWSGDRLPVLAWVRSGPIPSTSVVGHGVKAMPMLAEPRPPQLTHGVCEVCAQTLHTALGEEPVTAVLGQL